jgi:tetratricopeptide (TPR) repeat protein
MRLIRVEAAESTETEFAELIAMGQYFAWDAGTARALTDLEQTILQNPESSGARLWLSLAYSQSERIEEAIQHARSSLSLAKSSKQMASSSHALARHLATVGNLAGALEVLQKVMKQVPAGPVRAGIAAALADIYAKQSPPDSEAAAAFYEMALRDSPGDNDLRFKVAYWYGDITMYSNAFTHYREILRRAPTYGSVLNNLGVAAKHLNMPSKSIEYYRQAQANGESLPCANLASLYLGAGFVSDAQRELDRGRTMEEPHGNVFSAMGDIARLQEHEDKIFSSLDSTAAEWRKFSVNVATALLDTDLSADLSGFYNGLPSNLQLIVGREGEATGTFFYYGRMARLVGRLTGRCLRFTWETLPPGQDDGFSLLATYTGHGLLISENDSLRGYFAPGEFKLNEVWSVLRTQWVLSDRVQLDVQQLAAGPTQFQLGPSDEEA